MKSDKSNKNKNAGKVRNGMKSAKAKGFIGWFLKGSWKKRVLKIIGGLICVVALYFLITVGITAIRVGAINMDSLYANIDQSSTLYDKSGNEIDDPDLGFLVPNNDNGDGEVFVAFTVNHK